MPPSSAAAELGDIRDRHAAPFKTQGEATGWDAAFAAADIVTSVVGLAVTSPVSPYQGDQMVQLLKGAYDGKLRKANIEVKKNPWFVANRHFDDDDDKTTHSPVTRAYLQSRSFKSVAGPAISLGGSFASPHTGGVNVASVVRHSSALGTTGAHWFGIMSIARANRQTATVAQWCQLIMRAKAAKAAERGVNLAGAAIPIPAIGAFANILAARATLGIKIGLPEMCYLAAIEIHWRAFQEQTISAVLGPRVPAPPRPVVNFSRPTQSRLTGSIPAPGAKRPAGIKVGPASRIFAEIFARRGLTAVLGSYDVPALIGEPGGWMALGDKIART